MLSRRKLVHGIGINDADYSVTGKDRKQCRFYARWRGMLNRCYNHKMLKEHPTYADCFVCAEWVYFSKFKAWMEQQDWEGKDLDKDILVVGNKEYGPNTCVFVDRKVNAFITDCSASRGIWPIGVVFDEKVEGKPYRSICSSVVTGKQKELGLYATPEEAHSAWISFKLEQAYILAAQQTDKRVAEALISRYKNDAERLFEQAKSWNEEFVE